MGVFSVLNSILLSGPDTKPANVSLLLFRWPMYFDDITFARCRTHSRHSPRNPFKTGTSGSKTWLYTLVFTWGSIVITSQSSAPRASLSAADRSIQTLLHLEEKPKASALHKEAPQETSAPTTQPLKKGKWPARKARANTGKVNKLPLDKGVQHKSLKDYMQQCTK